MFAGWIDYLLDLGLSLAWSHISFYLVSFISTSFWEVILLIFVKKYLWQFTSFWDWFSAETTEPDSFLFLHVFYLFCTWLGCIKHWSDHINLCRFDYFERWFHFYIILILHFIDLWFEGALPKFFIFSCFF